MQRNIVAERVLGLPHDVDVQQGLSWSEAQRAGAAVSDDLLAAAAAVADVVRANADEAERHPAAAGRDGRRRWPTPG